MHASSFYALYLVPGQTGCSHLLGLHTPETWDFPFPSLSLPLSPLSSLPSHTVITRTDDWFSVVLTSTSLSIYLLDGCEPYKSCLLFYFLFLLYVVQTCIKSFITGCVQKIGTFFDACSSALLVPSLMATSLSHCSLTSQPLTPDLSSTNLCRPTLLQGSHLFTLNDTT